jgi:hypothetical protein
MKALIAHDIQHPREHVALRLKEAAARHGLGLS